MSKENRYLNLQHIQKQWYWLDMDNVNYLPLIS